MAVCAVCLRRRLARGGGRILRDAFDISAEYLSEDRGGVDVEFDFFRYGQMGTRRFNSLKLWMALQFMGARLCRRYRASDRAYKISRGWPR